jgi:hypothetical protein
LRKESYDVGDKWYQEDNELHLGWNAPFTGAVLSVDKTKNAMDLKILCKFYLYVYTNNVVLQWDTTPFQINYVTTCGARIELMR